MHTTVTQRARDVRGNLLEALRQDNPYAYRVTHNLNVADSAEIEDGAGNRFVVRVEQVQI